MPGSVAPDRDALYYPYVHITDVNWLKSTLLCFPGVRRMVPLNYMPDDADEIKEFCEIEGPRGQPLLTNANLFSAAAAGAESELLRKLKENDAFVRSRFSRRQTIAELGERAELFRLHNEKIIWNLYAYLLEGGPDDCLAWFVDGPGDRPQRHGLGRWLALHPSLGSAILASKAVAIAEDLGLDIVTDSSSIHHTVVTKMPEDIFNELIGKPSSNQTTNANDLVDDLAEIVVSTTFDVSKLSAKQIGQLISDGMDLRRFKSALIPIAASIPAIRDPEERRRRLLAAANEVNAEWEKYRKSIPGFAAEALAGVAEVKWPGFASAFQGGTILAIGAKAGLGLAIVSYAGLKLWQGYRGKAAAPYSYLSKIFRAQKRTQSLIVLPPH